ncbi:RHS repeat-associated core domain-containing protein [Acidovorax soli]|uniref:RHS repeat domain-containing protein n=1 Tax=Acidovorax soli TaxID=592050 RepID=UPI0016217448
MPRGALSCLRQCGHWRTLAWSTAGSGVWHYNYFRSYSAERGRYTQADPIGLEGGFNRFGYVEGNALSFIDPFGLASSPNMPIGKPPETSQSCGLWDVITAGGKKTRRVKCHEQMPTYQACRACCQAKAQAGNYLEIGASCEADCDLTPLPGNPYNPSDPKK